VDEGEIKNGNILLNNYLGGIKEKKWRTCV
jgi:hypothetical protein